MGKLLASLLFLKWGPPFFSLEEGLIYVSLRNDDSGCKEIQSLVPCRAVMSGIEAWPLNLRSRVCPCPFASGVCGQHCISIHCFPVRFVLCIWKHSEKGTAGEILGSKRKDVRVKWVLTYEKLPIKQTLPQKQGVPVTDNCVTVWFLYLISRGPVTLSSWCVRALGPGPFAAKMSMSGSPWSLPSPS